MGSHHTLPQESNRHVRILEYLGSFWRLTNTVRNQCIVNNIIWSVINYCISIFVLIIRSNTQRSISCAITNSISLLKKYIKKLCIVNVISAICRRGHQSSQCCTLSLVAILPKNGCLRSKPTLATIILSATSARIANSSSSVMSGFGSKTFCINTHVTLSFSALLCI